MDVTTSRILLIFLENFQKYFRKIYNPSWYINRVCIQHVNLASMAFQDHVFKCQFVNISNLESQLQRIIVMQEHLQILLYRHFVILSNIVVFYVKLLLKQQCYW